MTNEKCFRWQRKLKAPRYRRNKQRAKETRESNPPLLLAFMNVNNVPAFIRSGLICINLTNTSLRVRLHSRGAQQNRGPQGSFESLVSLRPQTGESPKLSFFISTLALIADRNNPRPPPPPPTPRQTDEFRAANFKHGRYLQRAIYF